MMKTMAEMNYSTGVPSSGSQDSISSLAYDVTFIVGFLLLILLVLVACCICTRADHRPRSGRFRAVPAAGQGRGIDDVTLSSYPKLSYSKAKLERASGESTVGSGCSICLAEYKESDLLRSLPSCGHLFHVKCVDPWLRMHSTCPICRNSPVPGIWLSMSEPGRPPS